MSYPNYLGPLRKENGLTLFDVSRMLGVHESTISRVEGGEVPPTLELAAGCAFLFGLTVQRIFPGHMVKIRERLLARVSRYSVEVEHQHGQAAERRRTFLSRVAKRERGDSNRAAA